jgi:Ser/Thr protein kinase RdoA (MazF antagonist)
MESADLEAARAVLAAWGLAGARLAPLGEGLINLTLLASSADQQRCVLQRVSRVFPAAVNRDIEVITARLAAAGMATPRLVETRAGELWVEADGWCWRLLTWLPGVTRAALSTPAQAAAAGRLLARFHRALDGCYHLFSSPRLGVHDTPRHLQRLRDALASHASHARFAEVEPVATEILAMAAGLPPVPATPDRVVHGDPKINNMLFDPDSGEGIALVDLDTVGRMPLPLELGDAFRSWCNPGGENQRRGIFSAELFRGGLKGYATHAAGWITPDEIAAIVPATLTIIVELAARFCADALYENYFGWDPSRFASRSEHNQVRAMGQLTLARSLAARQAELQADAAAAFSG